MKNIKQYLDVLDRNRDFTALMLMSDPGLSKTSQIYQWAEEHNRNVVTKIISQCMPTEVVGMAMPNTETERMKVFDFDALLDMKDGDILFFDELTNGNVQTLNACLTLIQERTLISGKKLPSIMIVGAGNPQGACDMLPQTKQRFIWLRVNWDPSMWINYMRDKWNIYPSGTVLHELSHTYKNTFNRNRDNYFTARTAENLYRIAMNTPKDNPFWDNIHDISAEVINAIYKDIASSKAKRESQAKTKEFNELRDVIQLNLKEYNDNHVDANVAIDMLALAECHHASELKTWLKNSSEATKKILQESGLHND